jgi:hypothetical protein
MVGILVKRGICAGILPPSTDPEIKFFASFQWRASNDGYLDKPATRAERLS